MPPFEKGPGGSPPGPFSFLGIRVGAMRYLVTGGSGYIGTRLVERLGAREDTESLAVIGRALDLGVRFLGTADRYGPFTNEHLVGKAIGNSLITALPTLVGVMLSAAVFPGGSLALWLCIPLVLLSISFIVAPVAAILSAIFPRVVELNSIGRGSNAHGLADYDETVWDHLAGSRSAPFEAGEHRQVAVKVIDDRGNELLVVQPLP